MRFEAKVAVVAGGGDEVGRAIAIALAAEGAKVVIWDADADAASQVQKQIAGAKGEALCMRVDALEYGEVKEAVGQVLEQLGQIDIMVVVPPVTGPGALVDVAPELWHQQVDAQSNTAFNCNQAVMEAMAGRNYGKILNLVSIAVGTRKLLAAGVGGAIIASFTQTMAAELERQKVNVNCLAGLVPTPSLMKAFERVSGGKELLERQIAMSARGANTPEDVAKVALFLVSDDAERISGQTFYIQ